VAGTVDVDVAVANAGGAVTAGGVATAGEVEDGAVGEAGNVAVVGGVAGEVVGGVVDGAVATSRARWRRVYKHANNALGDTCTRPHTHFRVFVHKIQPHVQMQMQITNKAQSRGRSVRGKRCLWAVSHFSPGALMSIAMREGGGIEAG